MTDPREPYFDAFRLKSGGQITGRYYRADQIVGGIDAVLDKAGIPRKAPEPITVVGQPPSELLTERMMLEILEHEGIVPEAYVDSVGVLTWGVGVTSASGHNVERYRDNPQTIAHCLTIYAWLLRNSYLPEVLAAFGDHPLAEHELAAALSFHWNTGKIGKASWVREAIKGDRASAREAFMLWRTPKAIIGRRRAERDLFFDGDWMHDGKVAVYQRVRKPSYVPDWNSREDVDVREAVKAAMEAQ